MLSGNIQVNFQDVATWEARRLSHDLRDFNDYECSLTYTDRAGYTWFTKPFIVRGHADTNGAVSLAARVLMEGLKRLEPKKPIVIQDYLRSDHG